MFTSLSKEAMPIIRYRTRDLTRLLPPTARSFRRMGKIVGRSDDMLIIRGVNVFPTQIEEIVLQNAQLSGQYQIVVTRDGNLDQVAVRCELQPGNAGEKQQLADWVQQRIKTLIGISTAVEVLGSDSIERTLVGKARRVIDNVLVEGGAAMYTQAMDLMGKEGRAEALVLQRRGAGAGSAL